MLALLLACAPPTLPTDTDTDTDSTTTPVDTGSPTSFCTWAGQWDVDPRCDGVTVGIPGTGSAEVTDRCWVTAHLVASAWDGNDSYACTTTEQLALGDLDEVTGSYPSQSLGSAVDPYGCAELPALSPFDLDVVVTIGPDAVTLSFPGQAPWMLHDCAGTPELVLTPWTGR